MKEYLMILDFLENSEYVKREQIAIKLNISKRKTQKLIDDLNHMLMPAALKLNQKQV